MDARRVLGREGEEIAARWLARRGWSILDRNVHYREGELDLVAARDGVIAFVEVKTRSSGSHGFGLEAVTPTKQSRIRHLAIRYLSEHSVSAEEIRFDVISCDREDGGFRVSHIERAF